MEFNIEVRYTIDDLKRIMKILRSNEGCQWDKKQTHKSIRNNFIEETYEVIEAIDTEDEILLREELGDVLLQIIFHSEIEAEQENFCFDDVVHDICEKLMIRHPHVFSDTKVNSTEEVLENWNEIKKEQKGHTTYTQTLNAVPKQLPALMRAQKVQSRAQKAGFCYPQNVNMALEHLKCEIDELTSAINNNDLQNITEEIGDILFATINVSHLLKNEGEEALTKSTEKFIKRFEIVEKLAENKAIILKDADVETLNHLWKQAKISIQED